MILSSPGGDMPAR
jgi:hypothetical protein